MTRRRPLIGMVLLVLCTGCDGPPEPCDPLCPAALQRVEACLGEWDQQWGEGFGYLDPDDYENWCQTYLDEQLALAVDRDGFDGGRAWVAETCTAQVAALEAGDCEAYVTS
jgi:hypothetical protein